MANAEAWTQRSAYVRASHHLSGHGGLPDEVGSPRGGRRTRQSSELHLAQAVEQGFGKLLAVQLLPEILIQPAAIHLGLRRRRAGEQAERHEADECRPEHAFLRWL